MSTLTSKALKAGAWYSVMRFASQILSWFFTIYTARLLTPSDFGLMAMAAFFTAQLETFSEMGLGVAIVQRGEVSSKELSSLFWFACVLGVVLSGVTLLLAYPTVWVFREPKVKYVTMLIAPLFLAGAFAVVPLSFLKREFKFKVIATIDFVSMILSSIVTIVMARHGHGVYSLVVGLIVLRVSKSILLFSFSGWRPQLIFAVSGVLPFLRMGIQVIMSGVMLRSLESLDKLIIGRYFNSVILGLYGYAMTLSSIPTQKIWPIFNELLLSTLSRVQHEKEQIRAITLSTLQYFLYIIAPVLFGGGAFGEEVILGILGVKWEGAVPFFRVFCFSQLFFLVGIYFTVVNNALGKPYRNLRYNFISSLLILVSIYFCARIGQDYIMLPWIIILPIIVVCWIYINISNLDINPQSYLATLMKGGGPGATIVLFIYVCRNIATHQFSLSLSHLALVIIEVVAGGGLYVGYFVIFKKKEAKKIVQLLRKG